MLVVIPALVVVNLPIQPAAAGQFISPQLLAVPHRLRKRQPLRLVRRRIGKAALSGRHRSETPEGLIVGSQRFALIGRHVLLVRTDLVEQRIGYQVVILAGRLP